MLVILHQSPLRVVTETEALASLTSEQLAQARRVEQVDTRTFAADIDGNHWRTSESYLRAQGNALATLAHLHGDEGAIYFGIAEVPHVIALGSFIGDERLIEARDYDRDSNSWSWPGSNEDLEIEMLGAPREQVAQSGDAVLRIQISYAVKDSDVDAAVGKERLADVSIRPAKKAPAPGLVRSAADVARIRSKVREALAALSSARPNLQTIHLLVSAPVSVCFSIGQELRLRNMPSVQTYRYRANNSGGALTAAIRLNDRRIDRIERPVSTEELRIAADVRIVWANALDDVKSLATMLATGTSKVPRSESRGTESAATVGLRAFLLDSGLRPLSTVVNPEDRISERSFDGEFQLSKEPREWQLNDRLVLSLYSAAEKNSERVRDFARLFLFHEYVHDWQVLTAYTSGNIGSMPNCLERVDYLADTYAILHQVSFLNPTHLVSESVVRASLLEQIGIAIRSFWSFESSPPVYEWQERRIRRYLNWYWRRVQVREAPNLQTALRLLARVPCIEIAGVRQSVGAGRTRINFAEPHQEDGLHIGIVLEDGRLERRGSSTDVNIKALLTAFAQHDQSAIERFFNALFDHVRGTGGVFPLGS